MRDAVEGSSGELVLDAQRVRLVRRQLDALAEDCGAVRSTLRAASSAASAWPVDAAGPLAELRGRATALLDGLAAGAETSAADLAARSEQLRERVRRARRIDHDTADRLRAVQHDREVGWTRPGGHHPGGSRA